MASQNKNTKSKDKIEIPTGIEKIHPYKILLFLGAFGSFLIFLFLLIAFTALLKNGNSQPIQLPKSFMLSTLIIIGSSFLVFLADIKLKQEDAKGILKFLGFNIISTSLFLSLQSFAWVDMYHQGLFFDGHPAASFLYVLSGLHMVHLFMGLGFLIHAFATLGKKTKDDIKRLIFFSNPYEKTRLEVLFLYWHYLGVLWLIIYLYLFFAI